MTVYTESEEPTLDLTPYRASDEEPTLDVVLAKSDCIWAAQEQERVGNAEAAASWLLVAGSL